MTRARWIAPLTTVAALLWGNPAVADDRDGFQLQPFDPSAATDRFFSTADATAPGDLGFAARVDGHYAYKRLLSGRDPDTGEPADVVNQQLIAYVGTALTLSERFLFGLTLPVVPLNGGDHPASPDGASIGDLTLDARFAVLDFGRTLRIAPEVDVMFPTGSQEQLTGDGTFGAHARALLSGEDGIVAYALNFGYLVRDPKQGDGYRVGPSATFGFAFGLRLLDERLQLSAEVLGNTLLSGDGPLDPDTTPIYTVGGVKFRVSSLVIGAGAGPSITKATGNSPRGMLSLGYVPEP